MTTIEKTPEMNRIYVLSELEKYVECEQSLISRNYKNVNEFISNKKFIKSLDNDRCPPRLKRGGSNSYSKFKVVNCFKVKKHKEGMDTSTNFKNEQHGRAKKKTVSSFMLNTSKCWLIGRIEPKICTTFSRTYFSF